MVYLDDGLCAVAGEECAWQACTLVQEMLERAGFVANVAKSIWTPTKRLGFVLDLDKGHIEIPPEQICTTRSRLESVCKDRCILARQLASIIGKIIFMKTPGISNDFERYPHGDSLTLGRRKTGNHPFLRATLLPSNPRTPQEPVEVPQVYNQSLLP